MKQHMYPRTDSPVGIAAAAKIIRLVSAGAITTGLLLLCTRREQA